MMPLFSLIVILSNGQAKVVNYGEAYAHLPEEAYVQALGAPIRLAPRTYREITQSRHGNTTLDNAIEQIELGR